MNHHHIEAFIQKHSTRAPRKSPTDPPPPPADIPYQEIDRIRSAMQSGVRNGSFQVPGAIMQHLRAEAERAMRADAHFIASENQTLRITKRQAFL